MTLAIATRTISFRDALYEALREEMERDETVILLGEDFANGGAFGVAGDLPDCFGPERVLATPISENGFVGVAVGAAMTGLRPVVEIMFMDFIALAMDQITNHASKIHYMYAGQYNVPLVIRTPFGAGRGYGASHSQSLEGWLIQVPGLQVVAPSDPADAKGLLQSAIREDNPVVVIENKLLYPKQGEIEDTGMPVPLGVARVRRNGGDITIASYGRMLDMALEAADLLATEGVGCEVIDLRTLKPLDLRTLADSVSRTGRFVFVEEGTGGVGAEACTRVVEACPGARVVRVAARDVPIPSSGPLEQHVIPQVTDIIQGCLNSL
ncbi:MAG TPA: alpha-ketoacid dehydrogenase subunit beta [Thermomicrobiales bacterium]|nr:alpha-ketoacid dehydrogenase subunit beta [Thermomicrobiales bacterium]